MALLWKNLFREYVPELKRVGMSEEDIQKLEVEVANRINEEDPPKIAWVGLTGVGKSSTLNALFNAGRETNGVVACTKEEAAVYGNISKYIGSKGDIMVYDMPGLGEGIKEDNHHMETYKRVLPNVDVVVWTISAGDRKMEPEQRALLRLKQEFGRKFLERLVIVINKADITDPGETSWRKEMNMPCLEQQKNMEIFEQEVLKKVKDVLPEWKGNLVTYSAKYRYRLDVLMTAIVEAVPKNRRWVYDRRADVADFKEFIDPRYREYIVSMLGQNKGG